MINSNFVQKRRVHYVISSPMQHKKIIVNITEHLLSELNESDRKLIDKAREAAGNAYAPYSSFRVGAALLLEDGKVIQANNQENAAYPSGLCAERVAVFYANARYPETAIVALAIAALKKKNYTDDPIYPCGACRQVLVESENRFGKPLRILMAGNSRVDIVSSASDLLPKNFNHHDLA